MSDAELLSLRDELYASLERTHEMLRKAELFLIAAQMARPLQLRLPQKGSDANPRFSPPPPEGPSQRETAELGLES